MKRLNILVDEELHRKLKMQAAAQGITMSEFVIDLLKKALVTDKENSNGEE